MYGCIWLADDSSEANESLADDAVADCDFMEESDDESFIWVNKDGDTSIWAEVIEDEDGSEVER